MVVHFTVENIVEAKEQVDSLEFQGYMRDNIYVFTHSKESGEAIADTLHTEEVGMEEQGVLDQIKNLFNSRGDELRNEMKAVGLSTMEAEEAERQLDQGKIVVIANRDL